MAGSGYSAGRRSIPAFSKELTKPLGLWEQRACSTWHVVRTYRIVKANMAKGKFEISTTVGSNPPPSFQHTFPVFQLDPQQQKPANPPQCISDSVKLRICKRGTVGGNGACVATTWRAVTTRVVFCTHGRYMRSTCIFTLFSVRRL